MDKFEYRIRAEEINSLIEQGEYGEAVKIADTIDWRHVKGVVMLCKVAELYMINRRYEESKEILLMANDLKPNTRKVIYSLCELSIKLDETVQAVEYYKQYIQIAPRDPDRFILQYRIYESQDVSLEERIAVLEELKKKDYQEKWAWELAYLYHRIGLATRCVEECDQLILFFVEGKYVNMAMELKMMHAPLTPSQQEKYNARFMEEQEAIALTEEDDEDERSMGPSMPISVKEVGPSKAKTRRIPAIRVQNGRAAEEEEDDVRVAQRPRSRQDGRDARDERRPAKRQPFKRPVKGREKYPQQPTRDMSDVAGRVGSDTRRVPAYEEERTARREYDEYENEQAVSEEEYGYDRAQGYEGSEEETIPGNRYPVQENEGEEYPQGYEEGEYPEDEYPEGYEEGEYPEEEYPEGYEEGEYPEEEYPEGYEEGEYPEEEYPEGYEDDGYPEGEYPDDEDDDVRIAPQPGRRGEVRNYDDQAGYGDDQADEIKVRMIDAGNRFDTMNLEEETSRYLAGEIVKLMAEEDMEAADATRALPMNSIFHDSIDSLSPTVITKAMELAQEMNDKRLASLAKVGEGAAEDGEEKPAPAFGTGDMVEIVDMFSEEGQESEGEENGTGEDVKASGEENQNAETEAGAEGEETVDAVSEGEDAVEIASDSEDMIESASEGEEEAEAGYEDDDEFEFEYEDEDEIEAAYESEEEAEAAYEGEEETEAGYEGEEETEAAYEGEDETETGYETEDETETGYETEEENRYENEDGEITLISDDEEPETVLEGLEPEETASAEAEEVVNKEIPEKREESEKKAPEIEPLVFSQNKPLPKEFIEAIQVVAMEAAKEAAAAAAAAVAKEAASQAATQAAAVAREAASQAASQAATEAAAQAASQAARETAAVTSAVAREAAHKAAQETAAATTAVATQAAQEAARLAAEETAGAMKDAIPAQAEAPQEQAPMVEKQITGQLRFKDIIEGWEDVKKANEEKHIEEMKQRVKEQTGSMLTGFDASGANHGPEFDMLSPMLDVFNETEPLAEEVEKALYEDSNDGAEETVESELPDGSEDMIVETNEDTAEDTDLEETDLFADDTDTAAEEEIGDANETEDTEEAAAADTDDTDHRVFDTAEINGLEDKLLSALEGQHYDTANIQSEILHSYLEDVGKNTAEDQERAVSADSSEAERSTDEGSTEKTNTDTYETAQALTETEAESAADTTDTKETVAEVSQQAIATTDAAAAAAAAAIAAAAAMNDTQANAKAPDTETATPVSAPAPAAAPINSAAAATSGVTSAAEAVALAKAAATAKSTETVQSAPQETTAAAETPVSTDVAAVAIQNAIAATDAPAAGATAESTQPAEAATGGTGAAPQESPQPAVESDYRILTKEEKDIFSSAAQGKQMQQLIAETIDNADLTPMAGNLIITGEEGTEPDAFSRELVIAMGLSKPQITARMAALTAEELSGKDIDAYLKEHEGGCLIVDRAGEMTTDTCDRMIRAAQSVSEILLIINDLPEGIERLKKTYPRLPEFFTKTITIDVLDNNGLVRFAQLYANKKEYSIDDMGRLALYNRIEERQRIDHAVTIDEVKQIVDQAISKAEKKSVGHLMDIVFSKRYDKEDMVVLREKDFMP